jgi:hypothetical protein
MTERKFEVNDIVKIIRKNNGLDMLFPNAVHSRSFHIGDIGKIIKIPNPFPNENRIRFDAIMNVKVYKFGGSVKYNCIGEEIAIANKAECKRFRQIEQKYEAQKIAEAL